MTKTDIIDQISHSSEWVGICRKIAKGSDIHQDLFQEFIIVLMGMPECKVVTMHESGELQFYCVRVLFRMFNSSNTPFFRNYRARQADIRIPQPDEYDHDIDHDFARVEKILDGLPWYEREIFRAYMKAGSYRKLAKATGIVAPSIAATVNKVRRKIRHQITQAA